MRGSSFLNEVKSLVHTGLLGSESVREKSGLPVLAPYFFALNNGNGEFLPCKCLSSVRSFIGKSPADSEVLKYRTGRLWQYPT